jgi:hypothetical protein
VLLSQGGAKGFAQGETDIFNSMMIVNLDVARGVDGQVKKPCRVNSSNIWLRKGTPVAIWY